MIQALEYALKGDGRMAKGLCFDIHDNFKDIGSNQGLIDSSQSASQASGSGAAISGSASPINASDEASVFNSGNTTITNNVLDPGAIAAGQAIAQSGLTTAQEAEQSASAVEEDALNQNSNLAQQVQQGQLITAIKPLGLIAAGLFGIWALYKVIVGVFGGKAATT